ncbi:uncharacterized protein EV420DRAFT_1643914 [Desarmillaria tabescens]|uniref:CxC2-like cysteine cluster KDZ transposase-associated domain-containing protein n=1 Tax=Armillaria tabescens TaxID=1929756 RepID=A0AA39KCR8_ARMTA|nr:uncharacterized protein EV420DRAFT_1643914 [Desarmillaria tabescens]KAK0457575.1 hypothetical protein EV420DRAFT_1643914 [Desarmillaria tabescens]
MSKVSGYEFYHTLVRLTDNTGTQLPPDRFQAFMCMVQEWRHIKLLKRKLDRSPRDMKGCKLGELPIPPGTLAVKCPACPWPGINLDEGWENDTEDPWKYTLYVAIDANFRLVRLVISNSNRDPSLLNGAGFIVRQEDFRNHVAEYGKRIPYDPSDCCDHQAVKLATTKRGAALATSGVATVNCAWHDCKGPSAVTILDHGEEQVRIDYIFCSRKLWERIAIYPPSMTPKQSPSDFVYLIPKFHLLAHILSCHTKFSFYKTPYVGETDGEAPERGWSRLNPLAASLKVMGPGGYLDTLDDHIGDYNYRKTASMSTILLTGIQEAIPAWVLHSAVYAEFTATLPTQDVEKWMIAIEAWEKDPVGSINPFETTVAQLTTNKVRLTLAKEEAAEMAKIVAREAKSKETRGAPAKSGNTRAENTHHGDDTTNMHEDESAMAEDATDKDDEIFRVRHEIGPSTMILQGVELESDQLRLKHAYAGLGPHSMDQERAKVTEGLNRVRRRLEAWFEVQQVYMPAVVVLRAEWTKNQLATKAAAAEERAATGGGRKPRKKHRPVPSRWRKLLRPSTFPCFFRELQSAVFPAMANFWTMSSDCDRNITGQAMNTRAIATIKSVVANIDAAAARYRTLWADLGTLASAINGGKAGWDRQLRILEPGDVRALEDIAPGQTEGRRAMTWIWRVHRHETDAEETAEALRIEWCKTRARAHRWREEVVLVLEEMKHVKAFFAWEARTWLERDTREDISEGECAYALRQADMRVRMREHCIERWKNVPTWLETGIVPKSNRGRRTRPRPKETNDNVL